MAKISQKNLYSRFKKFALENKLLGKGDKVVVACSGGPDSVCLIHLLHSLAGELQLKLIVAHFNHKLRGREADADEMFVSNLAKNLGLKFVSSSPSKGEQIKNEEEARILRYKFLEKAREQGRADWIATAHNKNDVAETVLLNLTRGTGIRGLGGIPLRRDRVIRPLLFAEKSEIRGYLKENHLSFRFDKSNQSLDHSRNIMRHKIIPLLQKINPGALDTLARTAELSTLAADYISENAEMKIKEIGERKSNKIFLERKKFSTLSPLLQSEIVRIIASDADAGRDLSYKQIQEIIDLVKKNIGKKEKTIAGRLKFELKSGKLIVSRNKIKGRL